MTINRKVLHRPVVGHGMFQCFDFYKDIGHICSDVKFGITFDGTWPFLAVAVGDCFHVYSADDLKLVHISDPQPSKILHIAATPGVVATATESTLRITRTATNDFIEMSLDDPVSHLESFDSFVAVSSGAMLSGHSVADLSATFSIDTERRITTFLHPLSYRNKFLIGHDDFTFSLWNIASGMKIYDFAGFGSAVREFVQSPRPDVFAVALCDGRLVMHDVKADSMLFALRHPAPVTGAAFRRDGPGHLVVGLSSGCLTVWDLKNRQILASLPAAHERAVSSVCSLKNMIVTGGSDNSVRQWSFDDDSADFLKLHRFRVGHPEPPIAAVFAEVDGAARLVTASGASRLIAVNPAAETTAIVLSTAPLDPRHFSHPIKSLSATNSQRFASVASQTDGGTVVLLWDIANARFAGRAMTAMPRDGGTSFADFVGDRTATCCCLTRCGNFGCVGTDVGSVEVFVTQSGRRRGGVERPHDGPVAFVHVDSLNTFVVSSSVGGTVHFHDFQTLSFADELRLPGAVAAHAVHPNSNLLAVATGETVRVVDCQARSIAREFDVDAVCCCFSHDGRYLFVGSARPVAHVIDMLSARLIESADLPQPLVAVAAHPRGDVVATLHVGHIGTKLWHFRPERIATASLDAAEVEGLAVFSEEPPLKVRNIIRPPKDPLRFAKTKRVVPFFLTASGSAPAVADRREESATEIAAPTDFTAQMIADRAQGDFEPSIRALMAMDHAQIALEIAALRRGDDGDERLIFMEMLEWALTPRRDFEFVQALLHVFLTEFGAKILQDAELKTKLAGMRDIQREAIEFLEEDLAHALYLIDVINKVQ